ncbi:hypothetical protein BC829DRAFT_408322 [Chytridium lagenaria]|nr:hypothetical protein BC829DRAFT_408322 [Chytridium lagenaria]
MITASNQIDSRPVSRLHLSRPVTASKHTAPTSSPHNNAHNFDTDDDDEEELGDGGSLSIELLEREKRYRLLNKQLQTKTAEAVKKAEDVVKESRQTLDNPSESQEDITAPSTASTMVERPATGVRRRGRINSDGDDGTFRPTLSKRPSTAVDRPGSRHSRAVASAETKTAPRISFLPANVREEEIGTEATLRLLKAKLVVLQEEMERVTTEGMAKDVAMVKLEEKAQVAEQERTKTSKTFLALQAQVEKLQRSNEDLKKKNSSLDAECMALKKEVEQKSRMQKQNENDGNAKEMRLNRALEEVERYKGLVTKANAEMKEKTDALKTNLEKLYSDNKRLVKQKAEMIAIYKKQNQLIDILKRQKMHLESATLLKITEEEFVRSLNTRPGARTEGLNDDDR